MTVMVNLAIIIYSFRRVSVPHMGWTHGVFGRQALSVAGMGVAALD
jgi:hypothetical protein